MDDVRVIDLGNALQSFTRSAWRAETLDAYTTPSEEPLIRDWRAGRPPVHTGWINLIAPHITAGRTVGRVHAITLPPTEYVQFELAAYAASAAAGESVRIMNRQLAPELNEDFWIFDERRVAVMHYDDHGRFIHAIDGTHRLDHYLQLRDLAEATSTPLNDWTATLAE